MNIKPSRIKYLASRAGEVERKKAAEAEAEKIRKHVRLAQITNGAHPDYKNGTPYEQPN